MTGTLLHFQNGVPIDDLKMRTEQRRRLKRVAHVYWIWRGNPMLDALMMFKQLVKGKYADAPTECHAAQKDKMLFDFVVQSIQGPSREEQKAKVRHVADKLINNGMATDNGRDMTEGAKLIIKVDGLDQPEQERGDINKTAFLPAVVVTDITQVDDTKENIDDEETKRILAKYGGFVDDKRKMVEERVAVMEARSGKDEAGNAIYEE